MLLGITWHVHPSHTRWLPPTPFRKPSNQTAPPNCHRGSAKATRNVAAASARLAALTAGACGARRLMSDMRTSLEAGELSAKQLYQIFEWKCQRGKDRMNLLGSKLRALEDESVRDAFAGSCELFPADDAEPAERQKAVRAAVDALCSSKIAKPLIGTPPCGDGKVANREIRVCHGATEKAPCLMDKSKTPLIHLGSCRYLTLYRGVLDSSIIQ